MTTKTGDCVQAWRVILGILLVVGMLCATAQTIRHLAERGSSERQATDSCYLYDVPAPSLAGNPLMDFCP